MLHLGGLEVDEGGFACLAGCGDELIHEAAGHADEVVLSGLAELGELETFHGSAGQVEQGCPGGDFEGGGGGEAGPDGDGGGEGEVEIGGQVEAIAHLLDDADRVVGPEVLAGAWLLGLTEVEADFGLAVEREEGGLGLLGG